MARCTVNAEASREFKKLLKSWKKSYPHIESDVQRALSEIKDNLEACRGRLIMGGPRFDVYKYRQKSSDVARGSSYGLRIIALYDRKTEILYPILLYPKQWLDDVDSATIYAAVKAVKLALGHCTAPSCDGEMHPVKPQETRRENDTVFVKIRCAKCNTVEWPELASS